MCTALSWKGKEHLFGRTLDLNRSCGEEILLIPQGFPLCFRHKETVLHHYAMVGMGIRRDGFPLLFEATNEKGLSIAGLNFPGNAVYHPMKNGADNITPFEFIPWVLGQCADCDEAEQLLARGRGADRLNLDKAGIFLLQGESLFFNQVAGVFDAYIFQLGQGGEVCVLCNAATADDSDGNGLTHVFFLHSGGFLLSLYYHAEKK